MNSRDPDKPDKSTIRNMCVLSDKALTVVFCDTDISKSNLAGACVTSLSTGNFFLSNGINRDSDGLGDKETQSWLIQPDMGYELERADKTKYI